MFVMPKVGWVMHGRLKFFHEVWHYQGLKDYVNKFSCCRQRNSLQSWLAACSWKNCETKRLKDER